MYQSHQNLLLLDNNSWVLSRATVISLFFTMCVQIWSQFNMNLRIHPLFQNHRTLQLDNTIVIFFFLLFLLLWDLFKKFVSLSASDLFRFWYHEISDAKKLYKTKTKQKHKTSEGRCAYLLIVWYIISLRMKLTKIFVSKISVLHSKIRLNFGVCVIHSLYNLFFL